LSWFGMIQSLGSVVSGASGVSAMGVPLDTLG
jgi:hypothetical protein